jgi:hypothetical protein
MLFFYKNMQKTAVAGVFIAFAAIKNIAKNVA